MDEFKLDFAGIGVAKAGTTWIAKCLGEHPQVCMARFKETNFFLRSHMSSGLPGPRAKDASRYDEGMQWYEERFALRKPGQLCGEFSPAYLGDPDCASLLHAHNPRMKLLCSFRNPVDTAYAAYFQLARVRPLPDTFEEFMANYPELLEYGRYDHKLRPFLKLFPHEQVHLMLFEDIRADPAACYRRICEFLKIKTDFVPQSLHQKVNPRRVLRSRALRNLRCAVRDIVASTAPTRRIWSALVRMGAHRVTEQVFEWNEMRGTVPPMAPETRRRLVEYYRKENETLEKLMDRDLSHWSEIREEGRAPESRPSTMQKSSES